jgi:CheY-like chemotaxis protein
LTVESPGEGLIAQDDSRVLLIDDNEADNEFHSIMLRRAGFTGEIVIYESAEVAREMLRANQPSGARTLVLLDINMPGMNGFEFVAAAARMLSAAESIAVVMLTSSAAETDRQRAKDFPSIREYLVKPLVEESARDLLRKYLS